MHNLANAQKVGDAQLNYALCIMHYELAEGWIMHCALCIMNLVKLCESLTA